MVKVTVGGAEKTFTPEEISAMVLGKVRLRVYGHGTAESTVNNRIDEGNR